MKREFLKSNKTRYRLLRTIAQGIIGVIVSNVDLLVSWLTIPPEFKPLIVAIVMAILSPIMSELGKDNDTDCMYSNNDNDAEEEGDQDVE